MPKDVKPAILAALLGVHERAGTGMLTMDKLARQLGVPVERLDDACRDLEVDHLVVCTPVVGAVEMVCLTVNGVRRARRPA